MKKKIGTMLAAVMVLNTVSSMAYGFNPLKNYNLYEDTHPAYDDSERETVMRDILPNAQPDAGRLPKLPDITEIDNSRSTTADKGKSRNELLRESSQRTFADTETKPAWETNPSFYPEPSFESIVAKYKKSDFAGCMQECEAYVNKHPNDTLGFYYLAMCYTKVSDKENAIKAYEKVIALNDNPMIVKYATNGRNCVMDQGKEQCFPNVNEPELIYPYADYIEQNAAYLTPVDPQTLIDRNLNELKTKLGNVQKENDDNTNNDNKDKEVIKLPFGDQDDELDKFINAPYGNGLSPELNNQYKQIQLKKIQSTINNGDNSEEKEMHNWKNIHDFDNNKTDAETVKIAYSPSNEWEQLQKDPEFIKNKQDFEQLQMMLGTNTSDRTSDITDMLPYMTEDNAKNMSPEMIQSMLIQSMIGNVSL